MECSNRLLSPTARRSMGTVVEWLKFQQFPVLRLRYLAALKLARKIFRFTKMELVRSLIHSVVRRQRSCRHQYGSDYSVLNPFLSLGRMILLHFFIITELHQEVASRSVMVVFLILKLIPK